MEAGSAGGLEERGRGRGTIAGFFDQLLDWMSLESSVPWRTGTGYRGTT